MNTYRVECEGKTEEVVADNMTNAIAAFGKIHGLDDFKNIEAHRIQTDVPVIDCVNHG